MLKSRSFSSAETRAKAMPLVKADGPIRGGPGTDQQRPRRLTCKRSQQCSANASALMGQPHVCVADEGGMAHLLKSHDADYGVRLIPTPEVDPGGDLGSEIRSRHVGFMPTIGRDSASVGSCRLVDDRLDHGNISVGAGPNHRDSFHDSFEFWLLYRTSGDVAALPISPAIGRCLRISVRG